MQLLTTECVMDPHWPWKCAFDKALVVCQLSPVALLLAERLLLGSEALPSSPVAGPDEKPCSGRIPEGPACKHSHVLPSACQRLPMWCSLCNTPLVFPVTVLLADRLAVLVCGPVMLVSRQVPSGAHLLRSLHWSMQPCSRYAPGRSLVAAYRRKDAHGTAD